MGVKSEKFYVDSMLLIYYDENKRHIDTFKKEEITDDLFESLKGYINNNNIQRIELKNIQEDVSMTIFYENGLSHIGIVNMYNDIVYYYYNNSDDKTLMEIAGQVFENCMVCKDNDMLYKILYFFSLHGERYSDVEWIEE